MTHVSSPSRYAPLPHPTKADRNRRRARPEGAHDALICALNAAAARNGLDALLVTDANGFLVSRSESSLDVEELAAITPIVARGRARASVRRKGEERALGITPIYVMGETLYVAGLGPVRADCEKTVIEGARAAVRILAA